jgi:hypothetical protein
VKPPLLIETGTLPANPRRLIGEFVPMLNEEPAI